MVIKGKIYIYILVVVLGLLWTIVVYKNPTAYAIQYNQPLAYTLIRLGICISTRDDNGWTPLGIAIEKDYKEIAELLVEKGADVNRDCIKYFYGDLVLRFTPLMLASNKGNADQVLMLIQHGAKVNQQSADKLGNTPLIYAAMALHSEETVKNLLANGADVNMKNKRGSTPFGHATISGRFIYSGDTYDFVGWDGAIQVGTAKVLLDNGADVNRALICVVGTDHIGLIQEILDKGADANTKSIEGTTVLMGAAGAGKTETVKLLLGRGADINAKNKNGSTALMDAVEGGKTETVKLLLNRGADVNVKDNNGNTMLIHAIKSKQLEVVKLILDSGVDVNEKNSFGYTALITAAFMGQVKSVQLLLDSGADVNAKGIYGITALTEATRGKNDDCITLIRQYGG